MGYLKLSIKTILKNNLVLLLLGQLQDLYVLNPTVVYIFMIVLNLSLLIKLIYNVKNKG